MTMEMWQLGFTADPLRVALLLAGMIPLLVGLSHYCGFEPTFDWPDDVVDAFVAYAVAFVAAGVVLALFGELRPGMPWPEIVGKLALQAVAGSVGALLAEGQLGIKDAAVEAEMEHPTHAFKPIEWSRSSSATSSARLGGLVGSKGPSVAGFITASPTLPVCVCYAKKRSRLQKLCFEW